MWLGGNVGLQVCVFTNWGARLSHGYLPLNGGIHEILSLNFHEIGRSLYVNLSGMYPRIHFTISSFSECYCRSSNEVVEDLHGNVWSKNNITT